LNFFNITLSTHYNVCQLPPNPSIRQFKLRPEVVIVQRFRPGQLLSSKMAPPLPNITTIQEEGILSVVPEVLGDPAVTKRLMNHFEDRVGPTQAENLMKWLLSIGDIEDEDLDNILDGGIKFPHKSSEFILWPVEKTTEI